MVKESVSSLPPPPSPPEGFCRDSLTDKDTIHSNVVSSRLLDELNVLYIHPPTLPSVVVGHNVYIKQIGTNLFPILKNTQYCNRHRLYVYPPPGHEIRDRTAAGQNQKFPARPTSHDHLLMVVVECMPCSSLTNSEQESLQQSFNSFRRPQSKGASSE